MKFIIDRETLVKPLQMISGVVERRQTMPILANILMSVKNNVLSLTTTDLEVQMNTQADIRNGVDGCISLPARKFLDICRALPEGAEISFKVDDEKVSVRSGKSRFTLSTLPAGDFPAIETSREAISFELPQKILKNAIERTHFAMAQQDVRYYLNGMLVELGEEYMRLVATDGHRLALCETPVASNKMIENQQVIIPRKGVLELVRLLADEDTPARLSLGSNFIQLSTDQINFISKLIDGRFPDYQNVVPINCDKVVTCHREQLEQALNRVSILSNEKYRGVRLEFSHGLLHIFAHNPEQEEAEEEIPVSYEGSALEIGFNVSYLMDALSACDSDEIQLLLSDANSCCLLRGVDGAQYKYVVMPMRL